MAELEGATFQDNLQRIWELLENDQVSSIGVHGMAGVGKSALVDHIKNELIRNNKRVTRVVVSDVCSIETLQEKIARKLGLNLSEESDDVGAKAGRLNRALSRRKNLVLILDNVREPIDLVKVGVPPSMKKGCKWMMTSRSLNVCREMNCQEMILVEPLSGDEGWKLFLKNLGHEATSALGDPEVEGIAKRMVEFCDGLPRGIITLAGAVSGVTEIQEWRHELRVLEGSAVGHEWMGEKVFGVLKYSFDRLNPIDQHCFLYCSLYPEDHNMPIEELVSNLVREKMVDEKKTRKAQCEECHSIVSRLVKVSLLESVDDTCVKMHDLVREVAHKITKGKTMVIAGDKSRKEIPTEEEWTEDVEKVSLMMNSIEEIPHGISPNCPKLATLLLQWNPLKQIASSFFTLMCGLRTLNLCYTDIEELPDSVSDLVNLTSLLLEGCAKLGRVPCVRKLKELRELDISYTLLEITPQGMEELRLQVLRLPFFTEAKLVEGGGWESLERFEGRLNMSDFNRLFGGKQEDSVSYSIVVGDPGNMFDFEFEYDTRELFVCDYSSSYMNNEVTTILAAEYVQRLGFWYYYFRRKCLLDELSSPASLEFLKVCSCVGIECLLTYDQYKEKSMYQALKVIELLYLEEFMGVIHKLEMEADPPPPSAFSSLRVLTISGCNKMKNPGLPLSIIEKLEAISIEQCEEIEEIIQGGVGDDAIPISLPNLKKLHLVGLPCLKSFCYVSVICNLLEHFVLTECPRLDVPFLLSGTPDSYKPLFPGDGAEQDEETEL